MKKVSAFNCFALLIILLILLFIPALSIHALAQENAGIEYSAYVENSGWQAPVNNGATAGTVGKNLQVEALKARLVNCEGDLEYNVHVENSGWQTPVLNGAAAGTTGQCLQIEAFNFRLYGGAELKYDIYYRAHIQDLGWLSWALNGTDAGSTGGAKAVEAFEVVIIEKGSPAPGDTSRPFVDLSNTLAAPSNSGALQVVDGKLTDERGTPVQLKGVSTHGLAWYPGYVNQAFFNELRNDWKANVVRLAMYTGESGGYCSGGDQEALKNLIRQGVDYAAKADLYVIVDWHILSDGNPNQNKDEAIRFFDQISADLSGYNNVLYEICNEPNGNVSWSEVKAYAEQVIPAIRSHDSDAVIIVGSPTWSQRIDEAAQSPIQGQNNIMYSLHFYAATHKDDLRSRMKQAVQAGLPVFVSEFGISDASGNGTLDKVSAGEWINEMNRLGISYVCWNLSNKNESSALFKPECSKYSGFSTADLSEQGKWLLETLSAPPLVGTEPGIPESPSEQPPAQTTPDQILTSENLSIRINLVNSWESGSEHFYQYVLSAQNTSSSTLSGWTISLHFNQPVELTGSWNGVYDVSGDTVNIKNMDYNGNIAPGASAGDIGFIVKSGSGLSVH